MINYRNYGRLWRVYGQSLVRYGTPRKFKNALATEYAYRRRRAHVGTTPYLLFVEPLYYCNLSCPLCQRQSYGDSEGKARERDAGKLSLKTFDRVLDEIGDDLFQCHIFGLGEPLIDWPLTREIVRRAHQKRIFTLVSTNATLITPEMADEIVRSDLDHLVCAIDGISQPSYSAYRVGGQVEDALRGMRLVCEARDRFKKSLEIEWQFLVNAHNVHELPAARRLADELGVFLRFAPMGGMEWQPELQDEWLPEGKKWQDSRLQPGQVRNPWHCYWLWRSAVINSNGQLARCPGFQNVAQLGDVGEKGVMSLYNGADSQRQRELFSRQDVGKELFPEPCNSCAFYKREHGGAYCSSQDISQKLLASTRRELSQRGAEQPVAEVMEKRPAPLAVLPMIS